MINSIKLINFEGHKNTKLTFSKGLNVFAGDSDVGKSTVVRAVNWVVNNRPTGDSMRRIGTDKTEVEINTANNTVKRIRTNQDNKYIVNDKEFESFGTSVPDEVKEVLDIEDVNLEKQFDGHFLLDKSSGKVAKYFNEVVHLDSIDTSISHTKSKIRKLKSEIESKESDKQEKQEKLEDYDFLPEFEKLLNKLEDKDERKNELEDNIINLRDLISNIKQVNSDIKEYDGLLDYEDVVLDTISNIEQYEVISDKIKSVRRLIREVKKVRKGMGKAEKKVNGLQPLKSLLEKYDILEQKIDEKEELDGLISNISSVDGKIENKVKKLNKMENKIDEEMPEICPLCGNEVNGSIYES